VSEQRRCEGVTEVAGESTSVEGEFKTAAAVDAATGRGAVRRGHEIAGFGSPMRYTTVELIGAVSRIALNQRRHPAL